MKKIEFNKDEIETLIDSIVRRTMKMDFEWEWPCGVAFYGISKAWEVTKKQDYLDYLVQWVDDYLEMGIPPLQVNTVSMGHTMLTLYEATGDKKYLDIAIAKAEYLRTEAIRFGDGVFQHTVSSANDFPEQAWADTLFMAAYFLLRIGIKLDNKDYVDDALKQYHWHEEYLQDNVTNIYYHGWNNVNKNHMSNIYWARANAWAALTMSEARKLINYLYPAFMEIDCALRDQLSALVRLQSPEGLWHTIIDDETSYLETSASAGIATSLVNYGHPQHLKYLEQAYQGICHNIAADGTVMNVSAGTAVMIDRDGYKRVPNKRIQGWGQGLALAFYAAILEKMQKTDVK